MRAELLLGLALAGGCIDDLLEAPYVLAAGLGEQPRSLAPTAAKGLLVAGQAGVYEIDGSGGIRQVLDQPALLAVGHRSYTAVLTDQALIFGQLQPGSAFQPGRTLPLSGVRDIQAWCQDQLLLLSGEQLLLLSPDSTAPTPWATAGPGARALALGPSSDCGEALVLTDSQLLAVSPTGRRVLAHDLVDARAVAVDRLGQPWVVHGRRPVLARIQDGQAETVARHLGAVVDMHFGNGDLLHPDNAYLLTADGTVDYVRVPQPQPPPQPQSAP